MATPFPAQPGSQLDDDASGTRRAGLVRRRDLWPVAALVVVLLAAAWCRAPILTDDRTWDDENAVIRQANALYAVSLPPVFRSSDVRRDPSFTDMLRSVRSGAYPPALAATVYLFRGTASPIRSLRLLLFALGLALLVVGYAVSRTAGDPWLAVLATVYLAGSTVLTHSSQQIKWNAVAPLLALAAAWWMLRERPSDLPRVRPAYVAIVALLLHVHYFCIWIVPGHLLWVVLTDRPKLRRAAIEAALALALAAPWYLVALPRQLGFVRGHFDAVAHRAIDAWNAPLGVVSAGRALGYDLLVGFGGLPSPFEGRYFAPLLLIAAAGIVLALRSRAPGRFRLAMLALTCFGMAAAGQTLYAARVGNVVPLQPHYLSPWYPHLMIGAVVGLAEIGARLWRLLAAALLIGTSIATLASEPIVDGVIESPLPRDYRSLCASARSRVDSSEIALVHPSESEAVLLNLSCVLDGWQGVGSMGMRQLPTTVQTAIVLDRCDGGPVRAEGDWRPLGDGDCAGDIRFTEYRRSGPD
jgi:hypothetical protein